MKPLELNGVKGLIAGCAISLPLWYALLRVTQTLTGADAVKLVVYGACALIVVGAVWLATNQRSGVSSGLVGISEVEASSPVVQR